MEFRQLGRTGMRVGSLGLGTEYLLEASRHEMHAVLRRAAERQVNFVDVLYVDPNFLDRFGGALRGLRKEFFLGIHLAWGRVDGQLTNIRQVSACLECFHDTLSRLHTDSVEVVFVHNVDDPEFYRTWVPEIVEVCVRLKKEGKARAIGFSTHNCDLALDAVPTDWCEVLMFPVNPANDQLPGRDAVFDACLRRQVGLVAMKPFAGGRLLSPERAVSLKPVQSGFQRDSRDLRLEKTLAITPTQCLSYVLSQRGVSTVVPGVKNTQEWDQSLHFLDASASEKDYEAVLASITPARAGDCVYCNHCLPCPAGLDIGRSMRIVDRAEQGISPSLRAEYDALSPRPDACLACGECMKRCAFGVDVAGKMKKAAGLFGSGHGSR